jgi:hypothetical protein
VQYSPLWLVLGVVLLLLIAGWIIFVLLFTRRRRQPVPADPLPGIPYQVGALRERFIALIDEVALAHATGVLDFRQSHQRLSLIVREFAGSARGIRAPYMTLEDLRALQLTPLSATVGELYPGAFSGQENGSVQQAVDRARRLVGEWR